MVGVEVPARLAQHDLSMLTADWQVPDRLAAVVLARGSSEWVGPGLTGLVVILAIGAGVVLLWRSMNKQLKKVRFDEHTDEGEAEGADEEDEGDDSRPPDQS